MSLGEEFVCRTTDVDVVGVHRVRFVMPRSKAVDQKRVVWLPGGAWFPVNLDGPGHLPIVCHLQDKEATGAQRITAANDDIVEFCFRFAVVDRPREKTHNIVSIAVGNFLHPLNAEPLAREAASRAGNHPFGGIKTVRVDSGRACRFKKNPGPASDIEKPAVRGFDAKRFADYERVVVPVVAGGSVQIIAIGEFVEQLIHGFISR